MFYLRRSLKRVWAYICSLAGKLIRPVIPRPQRKIKPKVFIIAMVHKEAKHWIQADSAIKLESRLAIPGLSRGYGEVYHTSGGSVCLLIAGVAHPFDLSKTYFLITGIAGVNPRKSTIGSVALPKFAIQVDTQMEFDAREIPADWHTGYVPLGADSIHSYPKFMTGSEIYELSDALRNKAMSFAKTVKLQDSPRAMEYRARFAESPRGMYHAATLDPAVLEGDVFSSNTFWHGRLLADAMGHVAKLYTNGKAEYVMTAQEDTAILAALLRAAIQGKVDFSRILITRAGSDFDGQPSDAIPNLPFGMDRSGGLEPALRNLYLTGVSIVRGILRGWGDQFEKGLKDENYVGDYFALLWGEPDFLPPGIAFVPRSMVCPLMHVPF